ncbi:MAG: hypothetical protein AB1606_08505 [Nitrospirota bacterium]
MNIILELKQQENQAILEGLAMMAYNPSIGRVLEKGGVNKFVKLMVENIQQLQGINNQEEFDTFHSKVIDLIKNNIKTNRDKDISYGQAQKPLNVFLKVFVDWSGRPTLEKASHLRKFLHVPLDSILMKEIKDKFPNIYKEYVVNAYDSIRNSFKESLIQQGKEVNDKDLQEVINPFKFSLDRIIFKEMYYAWQKCLRNIYPEKPVLLDVLWSMKRRNNFNEEEI